MARVIALCLLVGAHALRINPGEGPHNPRMKRCVYHYAHGLDKVRSGLGASIRSHPLKAQRTSYRRLVLGAGPGTTATRSLALALKHLNFKTYHYSSLLTEDAKTMGFAGSSVGERFSAEQKRSCLMKLRTKDYTREFPYSVEAVLDTPVAENFINYYLAFPESKVILSERPGAEWARKRAAHRGSFVPVQEPCGMFMLNVGSDYLPWSNTELGRLLDLHNEFVKCVVPPRNLLEFNVFSDSEHRTRGLLGEMAAFLGEPTPEKKQFPSFKLVGEHEEEEDLEVVDEKSCPMKLDPASEYEASEVFPLIQKVALAGCELHLDHPEERDEDLFHLLEGVKLHLSEFHKNKIQMGEAPKYTFGITTGHSGSTSLTTDTAYEGANLKNILFRFEGLPGRGGRIQRVFQHKKWLDTRPSPDAIHKKVSEELKPYVDAQLKRLQKTSYVDLGPTITMGFMQDIPEVFGNDVVLIRFRRDRYHTAYSMNTHSGKLCDSLFHGCPTKNEHMLKPQGGWGSDFEKFNKMTENQKALWIVDELEANYQQLKQKNPNVSYLECDWETDLRPCFATVAKVLGIQVAKGGYGTSTNSHVKNRMTEEQKQAMMQEDASYREIMGFDTKTLSLIEPVQYHSSNN